MYLQWAPVEAWKGKAGHGRAARGLSLPYSCAVDPCRKDPQQREPVGAEIQLMFWSLGPVPWQGTMPSGEGPPFLICTRRALGAGAGPTCGWTCSEVGCEVGQQIHPWAWWHREGHGLILYGPPSYYSFCWCGFTCFSHSFSSLNTYMKPSSRIFTCKMFWFLFFSPRARQELGKRDDEWQE